MLRRFFLLGFIALLAMPVFAHSNLLSIEPNPERIFPSAPAEIRLTFTEPLEAAFSQMQVYDNQGQLIPLPVATVPEAFSLVLDSSSLGTGVYTVAWTVVSATDGHPSEGTFPLRIGSNAAIISAIMPQNEAVDSRALRAFNLISLALLTGAVLFPLFIWGDAPILRRYLLFAWFLVGLSGFGILSMQAAIVSGAWENAFAAIPNLLSQTRFGLLWFGRMSVWLILGFFIVRKKNFALETGAQKRIPTNEDSVGTAFPLSASTISLILIMLLLLSQSLMSHASGAADAWAAVAADWLHLVALGAWFGGLGAFLLLLPTLHKALPQLSRVMARFSNLARVCVALLIITGTYAAWLHVGNFEALLNTTYGQALMVKLLLFLPLIAIGAINLIVTSRGLQAGNFVWSKRLRYLLLLEIALSVGIFAAVGSMTSVEPARSAYESMSLAPANPQERGIALLLTGALSLAIGITLMRQRFPQKMFFAPLLIFAASFIAFSGIFLVLPKESSQAIKMVITGNSLYLITTNGEILQPSATGYEILPLDAHAYDLYRQSNGTLWVATASGLYRYETGLWTMETTMPVREIISTHGFILALGESGIYRIEEGNVVHDSRNLALPLVAPANDFVMLSNHSHVLQNGDAVFSTTSVGLGWTTLDAPAPIIRIGNDENGNLLALTADGFYTWDWAAAAWLQRENLPETASDWEIFDGAIYVLAGGKLYRGAERVDIAGDFIDIAYQYPDSLWLLDSAGNLWRQRLGNNVWEQE